MKVCAYFKRTLNLEKLIFRKVIKSSFQQIKSHVIWSYIQGVMAFSVATAQAVKEMREDCQRKEVCGLHAIVGAYMVFISVSKQYCDFLFKIFTDLRRS